MVHPNTNFGDPDSASGPSATEGATWNFSYFAEITQTAIAGDDDFVSFGDIGLELVYDFDPGEDTADSDLGRLNSVTLLVLDNGLPPDLDDTYIEGSQNYLFGLLSETNAPFILTPGMEFNPNTVNPNTVGEYTIGLRATGGAVEVDVNVVPVPASLPLLLAGVGGLFWLR